MYNRFDALGLTADEFMLITNVIDQRSHNTSPEKMARTIGISMDLLEKVEILHRKRYNCTVNGKGPMHMQKYLIAQKPVDGVWDEKDVKIKTARRMYNEGTAEITTGRDGLTMNMYLIPRNDKATRKITLFDGETNV